MNKKISKKKSTAWRRKKNQVVHNLCLASVGCILAILGFFIVMLLVQAYPGFSWTFFLNTDSSEPLEAGILSAVIGSLWILLVTTVLGLTLGIISAVYLEEFSPPGPIMRFIELNINNLASVPPVLFGVFGLFVFLARLHLPRSCVLVGGFVLTMVILPTIIVVSRQALSSIPKTIRHGALALGASHIQVVFHHVLPIALPRILTGCLVALIRSFGETSPLLMVGMVAFIHDIPKSIWDPATTLPIQIYMWANNPQSIFMHKGAAAVLSLLFFLILLNTFAFWLRGRLEKIQ